MSSVFPGSTIFSTMKYGFISLCCYTNDELPVLLNNRVSLLIYIISLRMLLRVNIIPSFSFKGPGVSDTSNTKCKKHFSFKYQHKNIDAYQYVAMICICSGPSFLLYCHHESDPLGYSPCCGPLPVDKIWKYKDQSGFIIKRNIL